MSDTDTTSPVDVWVVYDGQCPFCSSYVRLYRLRALGGRVHLVDARSDHPIIEEIRQLRLDLDQGMVVKLHGRIYHGAKAMNLLAILGTGHTLFNWLNRFAFSRIAMARQLYPLLVSGRLLTLRLLGRSRIEVR